MQDYRQSAAEDRSVLVVAFNGAVYGLDAGDGAIRWEQRLKHGTRTVEVLIGPAGRVYASNGRELVCLEYGSGEVRCRTDVPDRYKGRPTLVLEGSRLYLGSQGEVTCFSLECEPLWTQDFRGRGLGPVSLGFRGNFRQADELERR